MAFARALVGPMVFAVVAACGNATPDSSGPLQAGGGAAGNAGASGNGGGVAGTASPDASAEATVPRGTVGAGVWFDTSTRIEVRTAFFIDSWGPGTSSVSGSTCWQLDRGAMSEGLLAALNGMTLIAFDDGCTVDGFQYQELTVVDADGTRSTYRDTGCSLLRVGGAMLPSSAFESLVPAWSSAVTCDVVAVADGGAGDGGTPVADGAAGARDGQIGDGAADSEKDAGSPTMDTGAGS